MASISLHGRLVFKLERIIDGDHIVLLVSGRIEFEHVATIERAIAREKGPTTLDLSEVTLVDRDVVPCLARLKNGASRSRTVPLTSRRRFVDHGAAGKTLPFVGPVAIHEIREIREDRDRPIRRFSRFQVHRHTPRLETESIDR